MTRGLVTEFCARRR